MSQDSLGPENLAAGRHAVSWFISVEEQLAQILDVIPYCDAHKPVWSPRLVSVLLDAGSQLDSLWRHTHTPAGKNEPGIRDYFNEWGNDLGPRWVVFFGGSTPTRVEPFREWRGAKEYAALEWWQAYNHLKHDRLARVEQATVGNAVQACAGLLLAIIRAEVCAEALDSAGLLASMHPHPSSAGRLQRQRKDPEGARLVWLLVESRLYAYPVGWHGIDVELGADWHGQASSRFKRWWKRYESPGAARDTS
jgi:hypothetical protein